MSKHQTLSMASSSFFILFSLFTFTFTSVSSFTPIDNHLIDCGSHTPSTVDLFHRRFTSDSPLLSSTPTIQLTDPNPSPSSSPLYHTARAFKTPSKYTFPIKERGTHLLRLHFSRFDFGDCESLHVQFHVLANGFVLLNDFKGGEVGGSGVVKDFSIWVDSDELEIMFVPLDKSKFAFVNAIEVISAPKDLVADVAEYVGSERNEKVRGLVRNGYEVVHRINVGGPKVTPFNDSLWRTWIPDNEFLKSEDVLSRVVYTGRIVYQPGGASREVGPDNVYSSARVIKSINEEVPQSKLTWEFPVVEGYKYLVRLHFCDIASVSLFKLYFNVYLNGNLAYENLDLSSITYGRLASPFYADFLVDRGSAGVLTVSVGPSNNSSPHAVDAILNGVEVMKMNNSMRSFDGVACAGSLLKNWEGRRVGYVFPLMAAMFMLLIASVIMQRRAGQLRDSVSWSPLPVDISDVYTKHGNQIPSDH